MISTVAELLTALLKQETKMLDEQKISHAPTIGSMYEGLTKNILEKSIPIDLNLNIVSGFITNNNGNISKQIDCMLVEGEGEKIPYTDEYKYDISKVIAVIEVKKNLYSDDLESAYKNLSSVTSLQERPKKVNQAFIDAHRQILRSDPRDHDDLSTLPLWKRQIGLSLYYESVLPIRIVLGYHGFSSEFSFREAFINYLERNQESQGFGPVELPNLIISGQYSLLKLNGMPYGIPIFENRKEVFSIFNLQVSPDDGAPITDNLWAAYASHPENPVLFLLQLLWTRLTYIEKVSGDIFGLDLEVEYVRPLLLTKAIEQDEKTGWYYEYFSLGENFLKSIPLSVKWKPLEISSEQAAILTFLGSQESQGVFSTPIDDSNLLSGGMTVELLLQKLELLRKANFVSLQDGVLRLLTKQCTVIAMPDGRFLAGDGDDPRLIDWFKENV